MNDIEMMKSWHARTRAIERAHFRACIRNRQRNFFWGGAMIALAAVSSAITGVVETPGVSDDPNHWLNSIWVDLFRIVLAIAVPVLAGVITFLNFQTRSTAHHHAAAKYAGIKRELSLSISQRENVEEFDVGSGYQVLKETCKTWDQLTEDSPPLYKKDWGEIADFEIELGLDRNQSEMDAARA